MQLGPEEPAHRGLPASRLTGKDSMVLDPFGIANVQRGGVNKADASTTSIPMLQIGEQRDHHLRNQGDKARIADQIGKLTRQVDLDVLSVIRVEYSIVRLMKMNQDRHDLTWP